LDSLLDVVQDDEVGGLLAIPVADTLKRADSAQHVASTESREGLWQAQTPQMFRYGILKDALTKSGGAPTDEAQAVEALGLKPKLVTGQLRNLKITFPQDLALAEAILACGSARGEEMIRIGQGYDVHQLVEGRKCIIGGVEIAHEKGLLGHSDADVLLHAICDAMLGALGLGDIGKHFPDTDANYKSVDSRNLLRHVVALLKSHGFALSNLDATIIAQDPKMAPHIETMCENIAIDCGVKRSQVNVKATTTEKLGFTGRGEGIAAEAVCLIAALA
jgi:2-C-methyl-D-erythritol 2,4-cyclodiphosphate synthase